MRQPLKNRIIEVKELLQADEKQMARHLCLNLSIYRELEKGARVLPLPFQKKIERRLERLLRICGINTEPKRQQ